MKFTSTTVANLWKCLHPLNTKQYPLFLLPSYFQGWGNGFQSGVPWNTKRYCWPAWLAGKKNFLILDALEWLKQYFDLGDSLLVVSSLKPFLSSLCLLFFTTQKSRGWAMERDSSIWFLFLFLLWLVTTFLGVCWDKQCHYC